MQRISIAIIILMAFISCKSGAQTADDIINKNIEARGGYDKIKSLRSVVFEGTSLGKKPVTLKYYYKHLEGMRSEFTTDGKTAYNLLTKTGAWSYNPFNDKAPVAMSDSFARDGIFQLDIHGVFVDYKSKGYTAVYEGKDTASGKQCYKIKLTKNGEGDKIFLFDDAFLLQKVITYRLGPDGKYQPVANYFFDYRKNEGGYLFSYRRLGGTIQTIFDKVTTNSAIPDSVFQPGN